MEKQSITTNISPTILVILGMTGDLSAKKIIPSLWYLHQRQKLPDKFSVIGFSRRELNHDDLEKLIKTSVSNHSDSDFDEKIFDEFMTHFQYLSGVFEDETAYTKVSRMIVDAESVWGECANKLYYLAVPPNNYEAILKNLALAKLNIPRSQEFGWSRLLIEKPFGSNLDSASKLQSLLSQYFKEEQIYRIDHYLFKEIVQGIENFRFSNNLFETTWDNSSIEKIELKLLETVGAEDRGAFYDSVGAFRDVGQNHLLSMLSALLMEYPTDYEVDAIRTSRSNILDSLMPWSNDSIKSQTYRGQYAGFKLINGVNNKSATETYFWLQTMVNTPKWNGVPITLEAGKRLGEVKKEIIVTLKHPKICHLCEIGSHTANRIIFRLAPYDEILIEFWTKKPGLEKKLEKRTFSFFLHEKETKVQYVEEYAKVIFTAISGERSLYLSESEVAAMWRFADPIEESWQRDEVPLTTYPADSLPDIRDIVKQSESTASQNIGIVGLGKMGKGIALKLLEKKWRVYGYNRSQEVVKELENQGLIGADSLAKLVNSIPAPRTIWLMVPHQSVDTVLAELVPLIQAGDTILDGGNSPFRDSIRREADLQSKGIYFLDVGVSGGPSGARNGACLMIGGDKTIYQKHLSLFLDLAIQNGQAYVGKAGAGHFVKMVHNGIEYGMMQAVGEGFEILHKSEYNFDLGSISDLYGHGSVITSSLISWLSNAYIKYGNELAGEDCCSGTVGHSGEGQWTVDTAKELGVPVAIIEGALEFRKASVDNPSYTGKVLSALRHEFGGHKVSK